MASASAGFKPRDAADVVGFVDNIADRSSVDDKPKAGAGQLIMAGAVPPKSPGLVYGSAGIAE
jgi:hypothetical protein